MATKPVEWTVEQLVARAKAKGVTGEQLDAFFRHVRQRTDGCWQWLGQLTNSGSPLFADCPHNDRDPVTKKQRGRRINIKQPMAHRTAYYWFKGILRKYPRWKLVQTCGHRACVNPAHLRQVAVVEVQPVELHTGTLSQIFANVKVSPITGCWVWTGHHNLTGYPVLEMNGHPRALDVLLYAWFVGYAAGEAEATHLPHHKCKVRACINPSHMELVPTVMRKRLAGPTPSVQELSR